jgi:hypothetical protein
MKSKLIVSIIASIIVIGSIIGIIGYQALIPNNNGTQDFTITYFLANPIVTYNSFDSNFPNDLNVTAQIRVDTNSVSSIHWDYETWDMTNGNQHLVVKANYGPNIELNVDYSMYEDENAYQFLDLRNTKDFSFTIQKGQPQFLDLKFIGDVPYKFIDSKGNIFNGTGDVPIEYTYKPLFPTSITLEFVDYAGGYFITSGPATLNQSLQPLNR